MAVNLLNLTSIQAQSSVTQASLSTQNLIVGEANKIMRINSLLCSSNGGDTQFTFKINSDIYARKSLSSNSVSDFIINPPIYIRSGQTLTVESTNSGTVTVSFETLE